MEEYIPGKKVNKRTREDSGLDSVFGSCESKRVHIEVNVGSSSLELEVNPHDLSQSNQDGHVSSPEFDEHDADVDIDSPEAKQIREDILDILDEPETVTDGTVPENQDLDSVIKSFEEEILDSSSTLPASRQTFIDLTLSDSGESQSDLGYLLEASDDELGLPPTVSDPENHIDAESRLGNTIGFENELLRYDSFDLGILAGIMDGDNYDGENGGDFETIVGGLFDYPDPSNFSELSRLPESLPAL